MKQILLLIILCSSVCTTQAQQERYIEVTGSAEMEVAPDVIVILVKLREYDENKEKISLEKIDRTFMNAVAKSNIERKYFACRYYVKCCTTEKGAGLLCAEILPNYFFKG